jgi:hypothetical protein
MSDKKPADYTKGLRDREMEIKEGIPSQKDMEMKLFILKKKETTFHDLSVSLQFLLKL